MKTYSLLSLTFLLFAQSSFAIEVDFESSNTVPIVNLSIALRVGASHDPSHLEGLTNFMGEMLLRGTQSRTKEQIDIEIDNLGANFSVDTRQEATIFRASVLSKELPTFLNLIEDILTAPKFPQKEINKLKHELVSGLLESLGSDGQTAGRMFQRTFYQGHPYSKSVIGRVSSLNKMDRNAVADHYKNTLALDRMFIVGSGDCSPEIIKNFADRLAKKLPQTGKIEEITPTRRHSKNAITIVDKQDRTQDQVIIGYDGITANNPNYTAFSIGNYSFGGQAFVSRMFQEVRVKRGYSYFARSGISLGTYPRAWQLSMAPTERDLGAAVSLVFNLVKEFKDKGVTDEEFRFAKESLINSSGFSYNTPIKRAENRISEKLLNLPKGWNEKNAERIAATSLASVNSAIRENLNPDAFTLLVLGTASRVKPILEKATQLSNSEITVIPYTQD